MGRVDRQRQRRDDSIRRHTNSKGRISQSPLAETKIRLIPRLPPLAAPSGGQEGRKGRPRLPAASFNLFTSYHGCQLLSPLDKYPYQRGFYKTNRPLIKMHHGPFSSRLFLSALAISSGADVRKTADRKKKKLKRSY